MFDFIAGTIQAVSHLEDFEKFLVIILTPEWMPITETKTAQGTVYTCKNVGAIISILGKLSL